ncbi:jg18635 [Pararge aegeria aegeria]|uniref:Jg18635 protein n=1 Tax=Pararge aegeria aegeria TaxID=348720 RepID=A0A8S4RBX4_9NEOP|nr:jg18635 [Pararge aegeria aegeria]
MSETGARQRRCGDKHRHITCLLLRWQCTSGGCSTAPHCAGVVALRLRSPPGGLAIEPPALGRDALSVFARRQRRLARPKNEATVCEIFNQHLASVVDHGITFLMRRKDPCPEDPCPKDPCPKGPVMKNQKTAYEAAENDRFLLCVQRALAGQALGASTCNVINQ